MEDSVRNKIHVPVVVALVIVMIAVYASGQENSARRVRTTHDLPVDTSVTTLYNTTHLQSVSLAGSWEWVPAGTYWQMRPVGSDNPSIELVRENGETVVYTDFTPEAIVWGGVSFLVVSPVGETFRKRDSDLESQPQGSDLRQGRTWAPRFGVGFGVGAALPNALPMAAWFGDFTYNWSNIDYISWSTCWVVTSPPPDGYQWEKMCTTTETAGTCTADIHKIVGSCDRYTFTCNGTSTGNIRLNSAGTTLEVNGTLTGPSACTPPSGGG